MPFYAKLLIFWFAVAVIGYLLRRFPDSAISKLALSWHGPVPNDMEALSGYMLRWAFFAFKHGVVILIILLGGIYFGEKLDPNIFEKTYFQVFFLFGLPLLLGMAILGALGCVCKSVWYRYTKGNCKFSYKNQEFTESI